MLTITCCRTCATSGSPLVDRANAVAGWQHSEKHSHTQILLNGIRESREVLHAPVPAHRVVCMVINMHVMLRNLRNARMRNPSSSHAQTLQIANSKSRLASRRYANENLRISSFKKENGNLVGAHLHNSPRLNKNVSIKHFPTIRRSNLWYFWCTLMVTLHCVTDYRPILPDKHCTFVWLTCSNEDKIHIFRGQQTKTPTQRTKTSMVCQERTTSIHSIHHLSSRLFFSTLFRGNNWCCVISQQKILPVSNATLTIVKHHHTKVKDIYYF